MTVFLNFGRGCNYNLKITKIIGDNDNDITTQYMYECNEIC